MDGITRKPTEDFPLDKISSVQWDSGMMWGTLPIFASGNKADIEQMDKRDGKQIADTLRARLAAPRPPSPPPVQQYLPPPAPMPPPAAPDVYEQLRKLGEFEHKKRELLSRI